MNSIKTLIVCVVTVLCAISPSYAQGKLKQISKGLSSSSRVMRSTKNVGATVSKNYMQIGGAKISSRGLARLEKGTRQLQDAVKFGLNIQEGALQDMLTQLKRMQHRIPSNPRDIPYLENIFQVLGDGFNFSGSLFKVDDQLFGAVATHVFSPTPGAFPAPPQEITLKVYANGAMHTLRGRPILSNPMLDVTLLAFDSQAKKFLTKGFELEIQVPDMRETLSSHGFLLEEEAITVSDRRVLDKDPFYFRTQFAWPPLCRAGLCGSAVINQAEKLVGIHVGSPKPPNDELFANDVEQYNMGYVAPSFYLQKMAHSFITGKTDTYPLTWHGKKVADLKMDEFVSAVNFYDVHGKLLKQEKTSMNFSHKWLEDIEKHLFPYKIEFEIQRMYWPDNGAETMQIETLPEPAVYYNTLYNAR